MNKSSIFRNLLILGCFCAAAAGYLLLKNPTATPYENLEQGLTAYSQKKYAKAARYFEKAKDAGMPEAMFVLGNMYINGFGVPLNITTAITYYRRAAEEQYTPALYTLALLYMEGSLVVQDVNLAHVYISKAAEKGDVEAMTTLATWYERGYLGQGKVKQAVSWYKKAAKLGDTNAQTALSLFYAKGMYGLRKSKKEAAYWRGVLAKKQAYADRFSGNTQQGKDNITFTIDQIPQLQNITPLLMSK